MARIPILQPGANLVNTGNRTARVASLTADTSGETWGKVAVQAGQLIAGVAAERREANDKSSQMDLTQKMYELEAKQADFQRKNPNQEDWEKHRLDLEKEFDSALEKANLSQSARQAATAGWMKWRNGWAEQTRSAADAQAKSNVLYKMDTLMSAEVEAGNEEGVRAARQFGVGVIPDDRLDNITERKAQAARDQRKQNLSRDWAASQDAAYREFDGVTLHGAAIKAHSEGLINDKELENWEKESLGLESLGVFRDRATKDPITTLKQLEVGEYKEMSLKQAEEARQYASDTLRRYQADEKAAFSDFAVNGGDPAMYKFQWNLGDAEQARMRDQWKRVLTPEQAAVERLSLESRIEKYDKEADPDRTEMMDISAALHATKNAGPQYGFSDLAQKWAMRKGGEKANLSEMEIADHAAYLSKLYKPRFDALLDRKGNIKSGKEEEFRRLQSEVTNSRKEYISRIGSNPTPEEARKVSRDILTVPTSEATVDYFRAYDGADNPLLAPTIEPSNLPTTTW